MFGVGQDPLTRNTEMMRPLVIEGCRLTRASGVGATSIYINTMPRNVTTYGGYVVIDRFTTECEVRLIKNRAGKILTVDALAYSHSKYDEVMFVDQPWVNALWFTAVGDDSTNNTAGDSPFARWGAQAATVGGGIAYLPKGTYRYASKLDWTGTSPSFNGVSLVGDGPGSILKATTTQIMLHVDTGDRAAGSVFRNGFIRDVVFEGNSVANVGIMFGKAVMYNTNNVKIRYVTGTPGAGIILDRSQNQLHSNLMAEYCDVGCLIMNQAANNVFVNPHFTSPNQYGLWIKEDATYAGYVALDNNSGNQNSFLSGIVEPGAATGATAMVYLQHAQRNLFSRMDFIRPATGNTILVDVSTDSPQNVFTDICRFNAYNNAYEPLFRNSGDGTVIRDCWFSDAPSAMDAIQTGDGWLYADNNKFDPNFVPYVVTAGLVYGRVRKAIPDRSTGTTADRPVLGNTYGSPYFDTTLGIPIWTKPTSATGWVNSAGADV